MKKAIIIGSIALVIVLGILYVVGLNIQSNPPSVGGTVENFPTNFTNGLANNGVFYGEVKGTIGAGSNQASWFNNTGKTVFVDRASLFVNGTASSTLQVNVGTSTTASIAYAAYKTTTNPFSALIDSYTLATSTNYRVVNSIKDAGTNGQNIIRVQPNYYVFFLLKNPYQAGTSGGAYESATSTARGFNLDYNMRYYFLQ